MSFIKPNNSLFALVDCNNFYVSCERVFNPFLLNRAVVILSNNDGCVIARSNEAKALNIPMGAPAFQYQELFKNYQVIVLSSNYTLYGQLSSRVMDILSQFSPEVEIYSIDEAFLTLQKNDHLNNQMQQIYKRVQQWTGIPVSIGVAPTKTLAKVANYHIKKHLSTSYYALTSLADIQSILSTLPIQEVWGIGKNLSLTLNKKGIVTAWQFAEADDQWIRKHLSVVGLRTAWELRGISCLSLEEVDTPKKSIVCSRSFGQDVHTQEHLVEALATYTARAAGKVRQQQSLVSFIEIFPTTNRFKEGELYRGSFHIQLPQPTDYTPLLISYAKQALSQIFKEHLTYKKAGVLLGGLVSNQTIQQDLFEQNSLAIDAKQQALMKLVDYANKKYGKKAITFAAQGIIAEWKTKRSKCSHQFMTKWDEILKIKI